MTSLSPEDIPAIYPVVAQFDAHNDLLAWVTDMSIGASKRDVPIFEEDKLDAYGSALKVLRSREGKPLRDFMKLCGRLALKDEIDEQSDLFTKAANTIIQNPEDEDAVEQARLVIHRFTSKKHLAEFATLYGTKPAENTKPTAKKAPVKKPATPRSVSVIEPVKIAPPKEAEPISTSSFKISEVTFATNETIESTPVVSKIEAFNARAESGIVEFVMKHGSDITANRIYRYLEEQLPGITRDEARKMLSNIMTGLNSKIYRAGSREGSMIITIVPERAGALDATSNKNQASTKKVPEAEIEDMSQHELIPQVLMTVSKANHHKGISLKSIALELGVDEEEARRVANYLVETGVFIAEMRRDGKGWSKGATEKKMFRFPSREALKAYKDSLA